MNKLRKRDEVIVLTGRDKGKIGVITKVFIDTDNGKPEFYMVEGVNVYKRAVRPNPRINETGGIKTVEMKIAAANVAIFNPTSEKADRVRILADKKSRKRVFASDGSDLPENKWRRSKS